MILPNNTPLYTWTDEASNKGARIGEELQALSENMDAVRDVAGSLNGNTAGRNLFVNGGFEFDNEYETSFSSPFAPVETFGQMYFLDGWLVQCTETNIAGTKLYRRALPIGFSEVPGNPSHSFVWDHVSVSGDSTVKRFAHRFPAVRRFSGRRVYFTIWAYSDPQTIINFYPVIVFGTGGSGPVTLPTTNFLVPTGFAKFMTYYDFPDMSGKVIGAGDTIRLIYELQRNVTCKVEVARAIASFDAPLETVEGEDTEIYYTKSYSSGIKVKSPTNKGAHVSAYSTVGEFSEIVRFREKKYARDPYTTAPWDSAQFVTIYDLAGNLGKVSYFTTSWNDLGTATTSNIGSKSFVVNASNAAWRKIAFHYTIDGRV